MVPHIPGQPFLLSFGGTYTGTMVPHFPGQPLLLSFGGTYTGTMVPHFPGQPFLLSFGGTYTGTMVPHCAGLGNQSWDVVLVKGALTWENHKGSGLLNGKQMGSKRGADGEGWR
jgi:hypothetical protein